MKKILLILFIASLAIQGHGQSIESLFTSFSEEANVENVTIDGDFMSFVKLTAKDKVNNNITDKIESLQILDLRKCSSEIKSKFADQLDTLDKSGYETLFRAKDSGDDISIISKIDNEKIEEFIILNKSDPAIIQIKGSLNISDIKKISDLSNISR